MHTPGAAVGDGSARQDFAESRTWTTLLDAAQREIADPRWRNAVGPRPEAMSEGAPALHRAAVAVDCDTARRWISVLFRTAAEIAAAAPAASHVARTSPFELLAAAVSDDGPRLDAIARAADAAPATVCALAPLLAMPLLHAVRQRWRDQSPSAWAYGCCPVCAAWPAVCEARGLEGARCARCARCGSDWRTEWLRCVYCGEDDHTRLGSLVAETSGDTRKVETCTTCRAYVKTVTTLAAAPPTEIMRIDLATVDLDIAALQRGYARPAGLGFPLEIAVTRAATKRSRFDWRWLRRVPT